MGARAASLLTALVLALGVGAAPTRAQATRLSDVDSHVEIPVVDDGDDGDDGDEASGVGDPPPPPAGPIGGDSDSDSDDDDDDTAVLPPPVPTPGEERKAPAQGVDGENKRRLPPPEDLDDDDETPWPLVFTGSSIGCLAGGAVPTAVTATGLGLFYGGQSCGAAAAVVGGISGTLLGIPGFLVLAPCAVGGAACGAGVGALLDNDDPFVAVTWTIPGLVVGGLGGALAAAGMLVSTSTDPGLGDNAFAIGTALVAVGGLAALAGGPLATAGATLTRTSAFDDEGELDQDLDEDRLDTIEVRLDEKAFTKQPAEPIGMAF